MEIVPIFDNVAAQGKLSYLFAVRFAGEELDEYEKLYQNWTNIEWTREFLTENIDDLNREFWNYGTVDQTILKIADEADAFEQDLLEVEERIVNGESAEIVKELFGQSFYNYEIAPVILKGKAKGTRRPYLRLYGLHLEDEGQIIIFGGGIKLTGKVNEKESPHLRLEIKKADRVKQYLRKQGIQFID